ncbi:MAG: ABC transporter permease [Bacteroidota bacterium]
MKNFINLFKREFNLFANNSVVMAIFIGAPLLYGLLLGAVYEKGKVDNLPVLVVDLNDSPLSNTLIQMIEDNEVLNPNIVYDENELQQKIIDKEYAAILTIPQGFEGKILQKRHPEVTVNINTSNILSANYAAKALQVILGTMNAGIEIEGLKKQGIPAITAKQQYNAFGVAYQRFFNASANYMTFLWPGVLGVIIQQVFMLALALSFAQEFENKTFYSEFLPKTKNIPYMMLIKSLPFWIMGIGILLAIRAMFPFFKIPFNADPLAMIVLLSVLITSVTFLGILVSIAIPSQLKATEILMVVATPSFILSGFTWPLSQMPSFIVGIAKIIPLTHFLEGLRKVLLYNATLSDIIKEINALLILTVIFGVLSYLLLKFKIIRHNKKITLGEMH